DPYNDMVYKCKDITVKDIYSCISKYTAYFDNKSLSSFQSWCGRKNLGFLKAEKIRKR
ncbi:hypothetical protein BCV71DRAFT_159997, partial [Rhizopus microsporus]